MNGDERHEAEQPIGGLEAKTRSAYARSLNTVDEGTRTRLAAARQAAIAAATEADAGRASHARGGLAALAAAAGLAFAVVWLQQPPVAPGSVELTAFEDLDILLDEEELELFEELEFYSWLGEQPELNVVVDEADGSG